MTKRLFKHHRFQDMYVLTQSSRLILVNTNEFKNLLLIKKRFLISKILSVEFMERVVKVKVGVV